MNSLILSNSQIPLFCNLYNAASGLPFLEQVSSIIKCRTGKAYRTETLHLSLFSLLRKENMSAYRHINTHIHNTLKE